MITIQKYIRAQSLEEAYTLNQSRANRIVGGMLWLKMSRGSVQTAIDLCDLGLDTIEETDDSFRIGAMTTLRALEQHEALNTYCGGLLRRAVHDIVGVQFRNMATVGGSIWGRFGFSDVLTAFLAMDTFVELYKGGFVPLEEFAAMKPDTDILVRLIVKKTPGAFAYQTMRIQRTDFPVLACAVSRLNGQYRAVVGARPAKAMIVRDEECLLGAGITEESAKAFAAFVQKKTPTAGNVRGSAEYRSRLVKVLTQRCVQELEGAQ
ncbi:MAG: FAD binding domain-containing protein [Clostridia bacterium]|nr:FAD binding domain-containing protein [Clostridia bacterium]MBQ4085441.1 FAD binding domain-containing protein [Clostridia bacterium]